MVIKKIMNMDIQLKSNAIYIKHYVSIDKKHVYVIEIQCNIYSIYDIIYQNTRNVNIQLKYNNIYILNI